MSNHKLLSESSQAKENISSQTAVPEPNFPSWSSQAELPQQRTLTIGVVLWTLCAACIAICICICTRTWDSAENPRGVPQCWHSVMFCFNAGFCKTYCQSIGQICKLFFPGFCSGSVKILMRFCLDSVGFLLGRSILRVLQSVGQHVSQSDRQAVGQTHPLFSGRGAGVGGVVVVVGIWK